MKHYILDRIDYVRFGTVSGLLMGMGGTFWLLEGATFISVMLLVLGIILFLGLFKEAS